MSLARLSLFALLIAAAPGGLSQEPATPPQLWELRTTEVLPGKVAIYERLLGMVREAQREAGWDGLSITHQVRVGTLGTYYTATRRNSWSELAPVQLFNDNDLRKIRDLASESIRQATVQMFVLREDLGRPRPEGSGPSDFYRTLFVDAKRGAALAYEQAVQKLAEAHAKAGSGNYWIGMAPSTGSGSTYRFLLFGSWEPSGAPSMSNVEALTRAFGAAEGNRWLTQLRDSSVAGRTVLSINRPDLSYLPETD
ncbi:MAG: hypothetical protein QF877_17425 [Gammaproteobacteria bacterium]|jgi:hypothetical protein|nr:hypothetical protein [Gammaproteobacteria bacterium]|tara:strand:- start:520 stop:1278 length:759 start_codon:yes stop_codon:yes gene_type:complete